MNQSYKLTWEMIENYRLICQNEPDDIENWLMLGRCLVDVQQYDEAETALEKIFEEGRFFSFKNGIPRLRLKSLVHWRQNRMLFAKAYADMAMVSLNQGNMAESERLLIMALSVFSKEDEDFEYARAANRLGMVYRLVGAFESAEEAHYRAKALAEKHRWNFVLAETLGNLGMVAVGKERFDLAAEQYTDALNLYLIDDKHDFEQACLWRQMGLCCLQKGDFDAALNAFNQASGLFQSLGEPVHQSRVLNDMTLVYRTAGDEEKALETAEKAVAAAIKSEDGFEIAVNRLLFAGIKVDRDVSDATIDELLFDALAYFKDNGKKAEEANTSAMLGLMYLRRGLLDEAESRFRDSVHIEERLHRSLGAASDYGNLGLIAQKKGQTERARDYWRKAAFLFENSGDMKSAEYFKAQIGSMSAEAEALPRA